MPTFAFTSEIPDLSTYVTTSDARLSDARTPLAHNHPAAQISDSTATGRALIVATDAAAARTAIGAGTSSFDGAYGSLTGVPSTFTPAAHAASHGSGGSDAVTLAQSQVTNLTTDLAARYSASNPPPAPTNMVTTDSTQTISAAKTISVAAPGSAAILDTRGSSGNTKFYVYDGYVGADVALRGYSGVYDWDGTTLQRVYSAANTVPVAGLSATGTRDATTFLRGDDTWTAAPVTSVNTRTGAVTGLAEASRTLTAGTGLTGGGDLSADRSFAVAYGTTAGTAAQGNDARLSDARTPTAHAASHASGGADAVTLAQSQVTNLSTDLAAKYSSSNPPPAPSNMVTTDSTQTITGTKTLSRTPGLDVLLLSTNMTANSTTTTRDSPRLILRGASWDGTASINEDARLDMQWRALDGNNQKTLTTSGGALVSLVGGVWDGDTSRLYSPNNKVPVAGLSATGTRDATTFLRGDNTWAAPAAVGGGSNYQTVQSGGTAQTQRPTLNFTGRLTAADDLANLRTNVSVADPTNMVTTDTAQTISAVKTFSASPDIVNLTLTQDYTTTTPASPTSGIELFARHRARRMLCQVGPQGQDTAFQPAMFSNRIARWSAVNNSGTATVDGLAVTNSAAPTAVANATTNFYTAMVRARYTSAATAGSAVSQRSASAQWFLSNTANLGGFFFVARLGLNAATATHRGFVGLSATTTVLGNANPSSFVNMVGFGFDSNQAYWQVLHNDGTGTATNTQPSLNFSSGTSAAGVQFYEFRLFAPSGGGQQVYWSIQRLDSGDFAQGSITTDLPAVNTLLAHHLWHNNGTTAAAVAFDAQSVYIETDN